MLDHYSKSLSPDKKLKFRSIAQTKIGGPGRYFDSVRKTKSNERQTPEREHPEVVKRQRYLPEVDVWCHPPQETPQLTVEPEKWPQDEKIQKWKFGNFACSTPQVQDSLSLRIDVF